MLLVLVWAGCAAAAPEGNEGGALVVVYTQPDYQGVAWKITDAGKYDLHWLIKERGDKESLPFNLANDSIISIRVRPGCSVTLYEHGNFEGKSETWDGDAAGLVGERARQASSLKVEMKAEADEGAIGQWLQAIENDGQHRTEPIGDLNDEEIAKVLAEHEERFAFLKDGGEGEWYGDTTDEERVEMGEFTLILFGQLGYSVEDWTPDSFAQQVNNFYDWRKDLTIWRTMCLVFNVEAEKYEKIFDAM